MFNGDRGGTRWGRGKWSLASSSAFCGNGGLEHPPLICRCQNNTCKTTSIGCNHFRAGDGGCCQGWRSPIQTLEACDIGTPPQNQFVSLNGNSDWTTANQSATSMAITMSNWLLLIHHNRFVVPTKRQNLVGPPKKRWYFPRGHGEIAFYGFLMGVLADRHTKFARRGPGSFVWVSSRQPAESELVVHGCWWVIINCCAPCVVVCVGPCVRSGWC